MPAESADKLTKKKSVKVEDYDEPVNFQNVSTELNRAYGEAHKHVFQYILEMHGTVTRKQLWTKFILYYTCYIAKRNPATAQCVVCNEEQLITLAEQLVKKINREIDWMKMQLNTIQSEFDGKLFVCLVNKHPYQGDLLSIAGFTPDEVFLLTKWLAYIFTSVDDEDDENTEDADGFIAKLKLSNMARNLPNPITELRLQALTDKLVQDKWIKEVNGGFDLQPRAIAELENVIRNKFQPACCALCLRVVVKKSLARQCDCKALMHQHCFTAFVKNATDIRPVRCPREVNGCTKVFYQTTQLHNGLQKVNQTVSRRSSRVEEDEAINSDAVESENESS
ncbi:unnamed protein product, partial [Mesorhabditis belari]|uniref:Non-structural maintenance of chromosomes element 1 homolog n=1 Tax=Mesorhabditis belari TaxID=2138241 RepID=A0AAF3F2D8_9BILA